MATVTILPVSEIQIAEDRQRKFFDEVKLQELADSILHKAGLYHPVTVSKQENGYWLMAGERRTRVIRDYIKEPYIFNGKKVKPGHIPCVILESLTEIEQEEVQLYENAARENLSWQEKAEAIAKLHKMKVKQDPSWSMRKTARELSADPSKDPSAKQRQEVNAALFLEKYMDRPEVAKAKTISEAVKRASVIAEETMLKQYVKQQQLDPSAPLVQLLATPPLTASKEPDFDITNMALPPLPPEPAIAPSSLGELIEGSSLEILPTLPDNTYNIVLTDPPYGIGVAGFGDRTYRTRDYSEDGYEKLHLDVITELTRVCHADAHVYMFCDIDFFGELKEIFSVQGWRVRRQPLIWAKSRSFITEGAATGFARSFEIILFAQRGNRVHGQTIADVLDCASVRGEAKKHPDQKPVALLKTLLRTSSIPGDKVLDPFAGSGSIFEAAYGLGVHVTGIELSASYAELARMRLKEVASGKKGE